MLNKKEFPVVPLVMVVYKYRLFVLGIFVGNPPNEKQG